MSEGAPSAALLAFLDALPHAPDDQFVYAPGVGTFRAKFVRRGLERGVLTVHATGYGLCLVQRRDHGICPHCAASKARSICDHCACEMCSWFRLTEEHSSPAVSRDKLVVLAARLKAFRLGGGALPTYPHDDLL